jgi:hypothetical protein
VAGMATVTLPAISTDCLITWSNLNQTYYTMQTSTTTSASILPVFSQPGTALFWEQLNNKYVYFGMPTITTTSGNLSTLQWVNFNTHYEETAEQQRERLAREQEAVRLQNEGLAERRAQLAVQDRERQAADELAGNLLLACLSPGQAMSHLDNGWFDVTGSRGHRFRIFTRTGVSPGWGAGQSGNVVLLDAEGKQEARYCVHPPDGLPHADAWLAQKLALEADEDTVLAVANLPWNRSGHADIRPAARERQRQLRLVA